MRVLRANLASPVSRTASVLTSTTSIAPPSSQVEYLDRLPARGGFDGVLPQPPSDDESIGYFARHGRFLAIWYSVAVAGLATAFVRLVQTEPDFAVFAPFFAFMVGWLTISTFINIWPRDRSLGQHRDRVADWQPREYPSVDVWLPVCGEPFEVLENTWRNVANLEWPGALNVHVGDDRPSDAVEALAARFGFDYHVREHPGRMKKAGNLLHLFDNSGGEFVAIFDADFVPRPDFLKQLLPYFDDQSVGIVQSPQYFGTERGDNWLQRGAGAVQEFFYRAVQSGRNTRGGAICVGTSAIYRRAALDTIGGPAQVPLSEDVHTGFDLMGRGWRLDYVPVVLSEGLCPNTKRAYFNQQYRWCTGSINLGRSRKFWRQRMPLSRRLCFLSGFSYYLSSAMTAIFAPPFVVMLACGYPEIVWISNYVVLLPMLLLQLVVLPLWHRSHLGLNARAAQLRNNWTHVFAIVDIIRGRSASWQPTGNSTGGGQRTKRVDMSMLIWTGGLSLVATIGAAVNFVSRPLDFTPMLLLLLIVLAVVARNLVDQER